MKKHMKMTAALSVAAIMAAFAAGCGSSSTETAADTSAKTEAADSSGEAENGSEGGETSDGTTYRIGLLQYVQHDALDKCRDGFIAALDASGISYELDDQNAAGDTPTCTTIAQKFVNDGDDLIFAIATPAAQACAAETEDIPIVLTAVTDPAASGLVDTNEQPGGNVTGSSDLTPVADQIGLLKQIFPDAQTVGILYCSAESNSEIQAQMARDACEAAGMTAVDYTVATSNDIQTVVESMVGNVDVIYTPTDNIIAAGMPTVAMIANANGLPTIVGEEGMCTAGGLATYTIDYEELGRIAGEMAVEILTEGTSPADMPIEYYPSDKLRLVVNEDTAAELGVDVSGLEME
ncbi:MAG TPA: ABC transporter substrate-binding protein [Candidatus Lachnoclostridium stercorigallinarum]|uniref:ABC transporter substrate-binding protein n=1 Tax=Candidatus Lachnoclostridium stercorigallinarum TaxID=2838634 RepID=A0A9D2K764_9FIRM|nr:ABC transporter substrate-binding protein [Candidatus Lachnoclostridium stercorigallinarum]